MLFCNQSVIVGVRPSMGHVQVIGTAPRDVAEETERVLSLRAAPGGLPQFAFPVGQDAVNIAARLRERGSDYWVTTSSRRTGGEPSPTPRAVSPSQPRVRLGRPIRALVFNLAQRRILTTTVLLCMPNIIRRGPDGWWTACGMNSNPISNPNPIIRRGPGGCGLHVG